jgi:N-acetyl-gamma-glutamyl-phosphate/LysW-gamma-L-alpha-aminoadipyl-6-phosphate reductase
VARHRHLAEIEQEINKLTSESATISFTPHAVNIVRGILSTIHVFLKTPLTTKDVWKTLRSTYEGEPFIRFVRYHKGPYKLPDPKVTMGTNFCDLGFELDPHANRLILFSAIDNMIKGASGQGVQCLNIMTGIDESTGLKSTGFHPM